MASSIRSKMRCVLSGLMYETASKRVYKSKRCVLFMTFRPSQPTLFMAGRNWVPLALFYANYIYKYNYNKQRRIRKQASMKLISIFSYSEKGLLSEAVLYKSASSAYKSTDIGEFFNERGRSSINSKNKRGPKTILWDSTNNITTIGT